MKKIYLLSALALAFGTASAQRSAVLIKQGMHIPNFTNEGERVPTDTLFPGSFATGTPALYGNQNGGYVAGSNSYGDVVKAQEFIVTGGAVNVEELIFLFGAKYVSGAATSDIMAKVYAKDGTTGYTTVGDGNQPCPGTTLGSGTVAMADVDTTNFTIVALDAFAFSAGDFIAGFDMSSMNSADTLGLVTSTDGDGGAAELSWEKWSSGEWYTMLKAWPLDFDFAIWAVISESGAGIESNTFVNGMKMSINGNPVVDNANISFELEQASNCAVTIYSLRGEKVYTGTQEQLAAGRHTLNVDMSGYANGTYYVNLKANGRTLTKKLSVIK